MPPREFRPAVAASSQSGERPALRAKGLPRTLIRIPARYDARTVSASTLDIVMREGGYTNGELGAEFGGERAGAQLRVGGMFADAGEAALLYPLPVAVAYLTYLIGERLRREVETANDNDPSLAMRSNHVISLLGAVRALFCPAHP